MKYVLIILVLFMAACTQKHNSDLVITNANVITVDSANTKAEAIAIKDGKIIFVGSNSEVENYYNDKTEIIDAKGATVIPGFIESHAHFLGTGKALVNLDLSKAHSWDEIVALVAFAADNAIPGEWIIGRGWHQEKWLEPALPDFNGYPYNKQLSLATPLNPVILGHASGHAIIANKKAMELSNVNDDTQSPEGGNIVRDSSGVLVGVFEENAELLIQDTYDKYLESLSKKELYELRLKYANATMDNAIEYGITSFYDAASTFEEVDFIKSIADSNLLRIRLNLMLYEEYDSLKKNISKYKIENYANDFLKVNGIKMFMDGALGSRSAWMLSDYSDLPNWKGISVTPLSEVSNITELAIQNGFQVCTHAIGDKANHEILNIYSKTFANHPEIKTKNLRWRVEHAQHLSPNDIPRFAKLGIIAAMQSIHCTSDAPFVVERLGTTRAKNGAYVWRSLLNEGTLISNGTDSPVEKLDPIANFYAAVTRISNDGSEFFPAQKMTRIEALRSYTIDAAYALFREKEIGSIEVGKYADLTILSQDITKVSESNIKDTKTLFTIINGKVEFSAN